jgi:hypothetical protein
MLTPTEDRAVRAHYGRSLERSRERRLVALRRRRRRFRGRTLALAGVVVMTTVSGAALAATGGTSAGSAHRASTTSSVPVRTVQRALGVRASGIYDSRTRRAVKAFQRRSGLQVDGVVGPKTLAALGLSSQTGDGSGGSGTQSPNGDSSSGDVPAKLQQIAQCESGGNPRAVSADGTYRGKYQFDQPTWESLGGGGDPIDAPEAEQDRRATALYKSRGASAWPNCGS